MTISKTKIKKRMQHKSNPTIVNTVLSLRKQKNPFWIKVAGIISKPKRSSVAVNILKINKHSKDGDIVVVPGKVLGDGVMEHKITLAAVSISESAKNKVKIVKIEELAKKHPNAEGIKIIM
jgi:large subunit ribosomal protein L18e